MPRQRNAYFGLSRYSQAALAIWTQKDQNSDSRNSQMVYHLSGFEPCFLKRNEMTGMLELKSASCDASAKKPTSLTCLSRSQGPRFSLYDDIEPLLTLVLGRLFPFRVSLTTAQRH